KDRAVWRPDGDPRARVQPRDRPERGGVDRDRGPLIRVLPRHCILPRLQSHLPELLTPPKQLSSMHSPALNKKSQTIPALRLSESRARGQSTAARLPLSIFRDFTASTQPL